MNWSAIAKESNLPLTRSERSLIANLDAGASALSEEQYKARMKNLADARQVLKQMPNRKDSERQHRLEKAAMLKERLKMLRRMIPFISASAAKSIRAEMKQIAAQLAALGFGSVGTGSDVAAPEAVTAETEESRDQGEDEQNLAESDDPDSRHEGTEQKQQAFSAVLQGLGLKSSGISSEDRQLKETIEELKDLYKAVLTELKRKQLAERRNRPTQLPPHLQAYTSMDGTNNFTADV